MDTLYVISNSPFQRSEAYLNFELAEKGDGVLFIQSGVSILKNPGDIFKNLKEKNVELYACKEDLQARAIKADAQNVNIVDYDAVAELLLKYKRAVQ